MVLNQNAKKMQLYTFFNKIIQFRYFFSLLVMGTFAGSYAAAQQPEMVWKTLAKVKMQTRYEKGYSVEYPVFSEEVKKLNNQTVVLKGYILPLDLEKPKQFIFSQFPYNACFFCGAAGPETVMQVYSKTQINYSEKPIWIKGKLKINEKDPNQLMYVLEEAVQVAN